MKTSNEKKKNSTDKVFNQGIRIETSWTKKEWKVPGLYFDI